MEHKILLVDFDENSVERIRVLFQDYKNFEVEDVASNFEMAFFLLEHKVYDAVIVDCRFEEREELDLIKRIVGLNLPYLILSFISDEDSIKKIAAFEPVAFLTKPVSSENLWVNLFLMKNLFLENDEIIVFDGKKKIQLNVSQIFYIRSIGNYCEIQSKTGKLMVRGSLLKWPEKSTQFIRVHKSYVANKNMIKVKNKKQIKLKNGELIPISSKYL